MQPAMYLRESCLVEAVSMAALASAMLPVALIRFLMSPPALSPRTALPRWKRSASSLLKADAAPAASFLFFPVPVPVPVPSLSLSLAYASHAAVDHASHGRWIGEVLKLLENWRGASFADENLQTGFGEPGKGAPHGNENTCFAAHA